MHDSAAKRPVVDLAAHAALAVKTDWPVVAGALAVDLGFVAARAAAVDFYHSVAGSDLAGHVAVDSGLAVERVADSDFASEPEPALAVDSVVDFCLAAERVAVVPALVVAYCFGAAAADSQELAEDVVACPAPVDDCLVVRVVEVFPCLCFGPERIRLCRSQNTLAPPLRMFS